LEGLI